MRASAVNSAVSLLVAGATLFIAITSVLLIMKKTSFVTWIAADLVLGLLLVAAAQWFQRKA